MLASPLARFSHLVAVDRLDATKRDEPAVVSARGAGSRFGTGDEMSAIVGACRGTILARVGALRLCAASASRGRGGRGSAGGGRGFASRGGRGGARGRPPADDAGVGARAPGERHARSGWGWRQGREPGNADVSRERASSSSASSSGENDAPQRVSKLLAWRGLCSRREAEELIARGAVTVDGIVVSQGDKARPGARIEVSSDVGREWLRGKVTVVLNKPVGFVSNLPSRGETEASTLITPRNADVRGDHRAADDDWAAAAKTARDLNVCGRLDKDSRGLLVLTQDGALAKAIIGGNEIPKTYEVEVDRDVTEAQLRMLNGPVTLEGARLLPMRVESLGRRRLRFTLREGKKRQIRRVCEGANLRVVDLLRVSVGSCTLGNLPEGMWRLMTTDERDGLRELGARGGGGGGRGRGGGGGGGRGSRRRGRG